MSIESKLMSDGNLTVKIIRVLEGLRSNRSVINVMVSIRQVKDKMQEMYSVKVQPLSLANARSKQGDKFSINKFEAIIDHGDRSIILGPSQGIQLEDSLQNKGIGCYAFNELIQALKYTCPNYNFSSYEISLSDDISDAKKDLLAAFFSKFNISINFTDPMRRNAIVDAGSPLRVSSYFNESKVSEYDLEEYIFQGITEKATYETELKELTERVSKMGEDTFGGIPKDQLIKYTLLGCAFTIVAVFFLLRG